MLRKTLDQKNFGHKAGFRHRGTEVTRLEGFSDAVFAFAMTLLVVSLEVPRTFDELLVAMRGFLAFAICLAMLMQIWTHHYHYFRRYALHDNLTITLNSVLLFVVLFFVYPLKFLFTMIVNQALGIYERLPAGVPPIRNEQVPLLMQIYGLGAATVYLIFALLYYHALRKKDELELNELEVFDTKAEIRHHFIVMAVPVLSLLIVTLGGPRYSSLAGFSYFLYGPVLTLEGTLQGRSRAAFVKRIALSESL